MITLAMHGGVFQVPEKCADCGSVPTVFDLQSHLLRWPDKKPCVFCGDPIRVTGGSWKHFHRPDGDPGDTWGLDGGMTWQPHWQWMSKTPYGTLDVLTHKFCAKRRMIYADFSATYPVRPEIVPPAGLPREAGLIKCIECSLVPTQEDLARVAARVYSLGPGPCVYCGKPILLEKLDLTHFHWDGEHRDQWLGGDQRFEKHLVWHGHEDGVGSLKFTGHFDCALKAMPYHVWLEDRPGCGCSKKEEDC